MTKQEIEKAIENGESVWAYDDLLHRVIPYKANEIAITGINTNMPAYELKDLFATKQQAEHYLHHANITRTEQLPFYTFSEIAKDEKNFKMGKTYTLIEDKNFALEIEKNITSQMKIKEQLGFIVDGQERIVCDGSMTGDKTILAVLNQIQKEFEK